MELFKRTLGSGAEYPMAYNNIAYIHYLEGNDEEAIRYYRESLARQVPYPEAYLYMGHSYLALGRKKEAKESFTKAVQLYRKYDEPQKARDTALLIERIQ